jgi:hypothetical protein
MHATNTTGFSQQDSAPNPGPAQARIYTDERDADDSDINLRTAEHYRNLTRGLLCGPKDSKVLRIQSTHCEQQRWEQILWQIPDQLLWDLARGRTVIVHDQSERARETRAMWQGLQLVRIVTETAWFGHPTGHYEFSRGGASAYQHLSAVAAGLPRPVRKRFTYFRQHLAPIVTSTRLHSCYRLDAHQTAAQSPLWHPITGTSAGRGRTLL